MPIASNSAAIAAPVPQIRLYLEELKATRDLEFAHYDDLHRWSVTDLEGFWRSIWDYDRIESRTPFSAMLGVVRSRVASFRSGPTTCVRCITSVGVRGTVIWGLLCECGHLTARAI